MLYFKPKVYNACFPTLIRLCLIHLRFGFSGCQRKSHGLYEMLVWEDLSGVTAEAGVADITTHGVASPPPSP